VLKLFRTNHLISGVMLIFYVALIRSVIFILQPLDIPIGEGGFFADLLYQYSGTNGILPDILSIAIIFINALIINYLVSRNFLALEVNLFPGLFYILVSSCVPDFLGLSSLHLANTFLIMACFSFFEIYKIQSAAKYILNGGILLGISALIYPAYLIFFFWGLIVINSLRSIKFKHLFMLLTGVILPWVYVFLYGFWHGKATDYFHKFLIDKIGFFDFRMGSHFLDYVPFSLLVILLFVVLFNFGNNQLKKKFEEKKKIALLYWMIFFGLVMLLFCAPSTREQLIVLSLPIGVLLSLIFTRMKAPFDGLYHFLLLIFVVGMHYLKFLNVI
jgi:hypothetical protein